MKSSGAVFYAQLLLLLLLPFSEGFSWTNQYMQGDTLFFESFPLGGKHYKVSIVFLNEKNLEMRTELQDSSGVILQSRSLKAKLYPIRENESAPVLFDAEIFTAGYHCPLMIYIERQFRLQLYIDDAGCFAGEEIVPSMYGTMMRVINNE